NARTSESGNSHQTPTRNEFCDVLATQPGQRVSTVDHLDESNDSRGVRLLAKPSGNPESDVHRTDIAQRERTRRSADDPRTGARRNDRPERDSPRSRAGAPQVGGGRRRLRAITPLPSRLIAA